MNWEVILTALQTVSIVAAILVAVGTIRGRANERVEEMAEMRADLRYIKAKVEDMPSMRERLSVIERDVSHAHERIDNVEKRVDRMEIEK